MYFVFIRFKMQIWDGFVKTYSKQKAFVPSICIFNEKCTIFNALEVLSSFYIYVLWHYEKNFYQSSSHAVRGVKGHLIHNLKVVSST